MFSSGSLALLSSSLVAVVDEAVAVSPSAGVFLSVCGAAAFVPDVFLVRSPVLLCAMSRLCAPSARARTRINLTSVFIKGLLLRVVKEGRPRIIPQTQGCCTSLGYLVRFYPARGSR